MAKEFEKCNLNNKLYLQSSINIKEEFDDCSYSTDIGIPFVNVNNTELKEDIWDDRTKEYNLLQLSSEAHSIVKNDNVKIEKENGSDDIEIVFNDKLLLCDQCNDHYTDYCGKCEMLVQIMNGISLNNTDNRTTKEIPNDILEIKQTSEHMGVFALKVIPQGVKIGPFNGLNTLECPWRLKGGKFLVTEKKLMLNWMQHINPARNIFEQNLHPFLCEDKLYYRSNREIQPGTELLVYFGDEYEDSINKDIEIVFIPPTAEESSKDVFACTYCCLGFSSREYLTKHKYICPSKMIGKFSVDELTQCPSCKIYFHEKEYLESHKPFCCDRNVRRCISLLVDNEMQETTVEAKHLQEFHYKCKVCEFSTDKKALLQFHMKTKHLKEFNYECEICDYKTNAKAYLRRHIKAVHLKEFDNKCDKCDYKTNDKGHLARHIKTKHLKEFSFDCEACSYKTNYKTDLEMHINSKHLKEFKYKCTMCEFQTNKRSVLVHHNKSKHFKEFRYECDLCSYKSNTKSHLQTHIRTIHLKEFNYNCDRCDYKSNNKTNFEIHVKTKHLKEFSYECDKCDYKTNCRTHIQRHTKTEHLMFRYECEMCDYKVRDKYGLENHIKTKHLKKFRYKCHMCQYKTNDKTCIRSHIKGKHLKEYDYECGTCDFKTNKRAKLKIHFRGKHFKDFNDDKCEMSKAETNHKPHLKIRIKSIQLNPIKPE